MRYKELPKKWKVITSVLIVLNALLIILIILFTLFLSSYREQCAQLRAPLKKDDSLLIGERMKIERKGKESVAVNLYMPKNIGDDKLPVVFNIHGGGFVGGDADTLDTQSERISKSWECTVVTVNYKLMNDGITKQYAVDEVKDTVKFMMAHADEYGIDSDNIYILGYSAGGYHAMAAALQLHKEGVTVRGQILCYPFISDILEQYNELIDVQKKTIPPALFILAGDEPIGKGSPEYKTAFDGNGVPTELITYDGAMHGFIEENNPEYEKLHFHDSKSPEQEKMARQAETEIGNWLHSTLNESKK